MPKYLRKCHPFPEHMSSSPVSVWLVLLRSLVFCVVFCTSLLIFFRLCCLSFVDVQLMITPLVSSKFSSLICSFLTWKCLLWCYYTLIKKKTIVFRKLFKLYIPYLIYHSTFFHCSIQKGQFMLTAVSSSIPLIYFYYSPYWMW